MVQLVIKSPQNGWLREISESQPEKLFVSRYFPPVAGEYLPFGERTVIKVAKSIHADGVFLDVLGLKITELFRRNYISWLFID